MKENSCKAVCDCALSVTATDTDSPVTAKP